MSQFTLHDVNVIESDEDATPEDYYASIQRAINSGMWGLQGSYGRTMMQAIEDGYCMLGENRARDHYGNFIGSRDDVVPGTKGSYDYVVAHAGQEHADAMKAV